MTLPANWHKDSRAIAAYIKREMKRIKTFGSYSAHVWSAKCLEYRKAGKTPKQAQELAASYFLKFMNSKADIPASKKWNGKPHQYDDDCSCCNFLVRAGIIEQPGRMRYLGEFYAGTAKVCKEFYDSDGDSYTKDVSFANYLAAWRCEVCGSESTDGY